MNIFHPIRSLSLRFHAARQADPIRDWTTILAFSAIAFAGIVVWNISAFDTVAGGGVIGSAATTTQKAFDSSSLDSIHTVFESRAAEEMKYTTGVYRYADPSQ